ncbi:hypothetical protein NFI96_012444, partial [Prochilodus magdalenae]
MFLPGKSRSNGGWTALHLASYFGQKEVAEELLKAGFEVNVKNDLGDTPLHLAALTGRKEVVLLLLRYGACATVINGAAQTPRAVTEDDEIITMLEAAERRESRKIEEKLLEAAREGDTTTIAQLVSFAKKRPPDIHCKDAEGNTPLHIAACRGHTQCVDELLKNGARPSAKNKRGQSVLDLTEDDEIRVLLETWQEQTATGTVKRFEGLLWKRSNFLAWASLWVVLENGTLSWYSKQSDAECSDRRQGFKPLMRAQCVVKAWDKYFFTLRCCDGSVHQFKVSFSCSEPEVSRKKWLDAIEEHSAYSARSSSPENTGAEEEHAAEEETALGDLSDCLQVAESYQQKLESQVAAFACMVKNEDDKRETEGPELLKAREICELCGETSSALRHCLDLLSRREEPLSLTHKHAQTLRGPSQSFRDNNTEGEKGDSPPCLSQTVAVSIDKTECEITMVTMLYVGRAGDGCSGQYGVFVLITLKADLQPRVPATASSKVTLLGEAPVWSVKLEQEVEKNKILSEALQRLVTERHQLKQALSEGRKSPTPSVLTDDEFYDALTGEVVLGQLCDQFPVCEPTLPPLERLDLSLSFSLQSKPPRSPANMSGDGNHGDKAQHNGVKKHRMSLPAPMFSRNDVSIWSILKKCIGMELSKIAMPVIFNEPLSFLQRLTEYMEHTYLIHQANTSTDSIQRMKCVAAFAVSAVASQWERTGKPFNPLLGETYELIRSVLVIEDLGFRWNSEQVSHHPPVSAFHAEGLKDDFLFHGSIYPKLKFWGKSVEAEPRGIITLELPKHNEAYTWTNPTCCVHNIIVGQLWIEQYGNVEVINHKTGERCSLTFKSCGLFGKELHKVEGYILDKSKKKICAIYGKWTECLYTVDPATFDLHKKADKKSSEEKKGSKQSSVDEEPEEMPPPEAETVQVIPGSELIWRISPRPDNSAQYYAFSTFAMQLNELEEDMKESLPTTDCRLRPDIRALENGDIDLASAEKKRLEEKQRVARKNRSKSSEDWKTRFVFIVVTSAVLLHPISNAGCGSTKDPTHTMEDKTGSTLEATGTGTTLNYLTFTNLNLQHYKPIHPPLLCITVLNPEFLTASGLIILHFQRGAVRLEQAWLREGTLVHMTITFSAEDEL